MAQLVKKLPAMQDNLGSIPGLGRSAGEGTGYPLQYSWASLGGSAGKESACNAGDLDSTSLGWEDPLEKGKAAHSSILAWRILWTVWGHRESDTTERLSLFCPSPRGSSALPSQR